MSESPSRPLLYGVAIGVFGIDRLTKWIIESRLSAFDTRPVIPGFFEIVHSQNRGAAFGLFSESTSEWRTSVLIGLSLIALVVLAGMLWKASRLDWRTALGLALIFGGAMGNVFDRMIWGTVTDFLLFYIGTMQWPAFNAADTAIVAGSGLLLLEFLKPKSQPAQT